MKKVLFVLFCFSFKISIALADGGTSLSLETSNEHPIFHSKVNSLELDSCIVGGTPNIIQTPKLDTLEVLLNGRIFVRIDTSGQSSTGFYNFYENNSSPSNLIARIPSVQDTLTFLNGALTNSKDILIEAVDSCDSNNKTLSSIYKTMRLSGFLTDPCKGEYTLNWNAPTGFSGGIAGYRIYVDSSGNNYKLYSTLNSANATTTVVSGIQRARSYMFKVVAFDNANAVIISSPLLYNAPVNLSTNVLVPPPEVRCTFVNEDGSVRLSWVPAVDTVNNFADYNIQYKRASESSWISFIPAFGVYNISDNSETINGINAQLEQYDFRITSLAGCDGSQSMAYNNISSVFLDASQRLEDPLKTVDLTWNRTGVNHGSNASFDISKSSDSVNYSFIGSSSTSGRFVDDDNKHVCNSDFSYRVLLRDSLFGSLGAGCLVQSNSVNLNVFDALPPVQTNIQSVSYNLSLGGLNVYWETKDSSDVDSLVFIAVHGFNSGMPVLRLLSKVEYNFKLGNSVDSTFISNTLLDARSNSVTIASQTFDGCGNESTLPLFYHQTVAMNVGWLVKDSINKLSWNAYVGFDESFAIKYDVYYSNTESGPWVYAGSSGTSRAFEHKVPNGNQLYYYHVKASPIDPLGKVNLTSNSNIGLVYSPFVDTTISINEDILLNQLNLYPNPVKEQLTLKYSGQEAISIQIYNSNGQELVLPIKKKTNTQYISVQTLPKGIYFIKVDDGRSHSTLKFLKE